MSYPLRKISTYLGDRNILGNAPSDAIGHGVWDDQHIISSYTEGIRCLLVVEDGVATLFDDQELEIDCANSLIDEAERIYPNTNIVMEGVIVSVNDYNDGMPTIENCESGTDAVSMRNRGEQIPHPRMIVYDTLSIHDAEDEFSDMSLMERLARFPPDGYDPMEPNSCFRPMNWKVLHKDMFDDFQTFARDVGWDGVAIHHPGMYERTNRRVVILVKK